MAHLPISLQSLIIQCAAMLVAAFSFVLFDFIFPVSFQLWQLALAQGAIAAGLSRLGRQPGWWFFLHLGFFPAIVLAQQMHLPAWVYLVAFLVLVLFYWSSFRTRVPLYLSDRKAWQALVPLLPKAQEFRFIDLGSGLGDVLFYLESRFPQGHFYGTEIAPAPWLISRLRAWYNAVGYTCCGKTTLSWSWRILTSCLLFCRQQPCRICGDRHSSKCIREACLLVCRFQCPGHQIMSFPWLKARAIPCMCGGCDASLEYFVRRHQVFFDPVETLSIEPGFLARHHPSGEPNLRNSQSC